MVSIQDVYMYEKSKQGKILKMPILAPTRSQKKGKCMSSCAMSIHPDSSVHKNGKKTGQGALQRGVWRMHSFQVFASVDPLTAQHGDRGKNKCMPSAS